MIKQYTGGFIPLPHVIRRCTKNIICYAQNLKQQTQYNRKYDVYL